MADACNGQERGSRRRSDTVTMAALLAVLPGLAACESPFKGEPERPREQTGWDMGHGDADIPTQEEMDRQDEGLPDS